MVWPAIIAAAAAAAQGAGNLWSGNHAARKAWSRAKEAAQNAHQWEVNDLRAAGLNPVLSATGGSGASAQPFMATTPAIDAVSSAEKGMASAKLQADMDNAKAITDAQVAQLNAGTAKMYNDMTNDTYRLQNETSLAASHIGLNASQIGLNTQNSYLAGANYGLVNGKIAQLGVLTNLYKSQEDAARAAAQASRASARFSDENKRGLKITNDFYAADPERVLAREQAHAYGQKANLGYRLTDSLVGPNGFFTNLFKGAGSGSVTGAKGFKSDYQGDR